MPTYNGDAGNNTLEGSEFADTIFGDAGADSISALGGGDDIRVVADADSITGAGDTIDGGEGTDTARLDATGIAAAVDFTWVDGGTSLMTSGGDTLASLDNVERFDISTSGDFDDSIATGALATRSRPAKAPIRSMPEMAMIVSVSWPIPPTATASMVEAAMIP